MDVVWLNDRLLPAPEAKVSALDRGVLWGQGVFETLRAYSGRPWAAEEHYERLCSGAAVLEIDVPEAGVLTDAMASVMDANGLSDCGVRVTITRGDGPPGPHEEAFGKPNVIVTAWELPDYAPIYARGVQLVTMGGGGRPLAGIKTTSYGASVAGRIMAGRAGADDVLFVAGDGEVLEASGSNLVLARGRTLTTPPPGGAVLPGVTCRHVLAAAAGAGYRTQRAPVFIDDLFSGDEVVLTSSLREVYPVRAIDGRELPRARVADALRAAFRERVRAALGI